MSVAPAVPAPGPPKKTEDKSFFDVSDEMSLFFVEITIYSLILVAY